MKSLIIESSRVTLRDYDGEIGKLEAEWDRLDNMGNQDVKQRSISDKISKLRKQKGMWEKLYATTDEVVDNVPAHVQPATNNINSTDYIAFIKKIENAALTGYNKDKKLWFPHKSPEGGMPTIAYGHKIKNESELRNYSKGISDGEATKLLTSDLMDANKKVREYIKNKYKVNLVLTQKQDEMLTEFAFNLGGLEKFPKFVDAVLRNDSAGMEKEYKRTYLDASGKRKSLERRNTLFHARYLK